MAKTQRKYKLIIPDDTHLIKEGTLVAVISGDLDRGNTTRNVADSNQEENWFGFAKRNLQVDNPELPNAWKSNINGYTYYFDKNGVVASNNDFHVYVVVAKDYTESDSEQGVVDAGTKVDMEASTANDDVNTRFGEYRPNSEGSKAGPMTILRPKDQFALAAMQSIIQTIENPLGMSYGTICTISEISYTVAQAMYEKAIEVRNTVKNKVDSSTKEIFVNPYYDLDEVGDVVAYNTSNNLKEVSKAIRELVNNFNPLRVANQLPIWFNPMTNSWCADVADDDPDVVYTTVNIDSATLGKPAASATINEIYDYVTGTLNKRLYWKPFDTHLKRESAGIIDAINRTNVITP